MDSVIIEIGSWVLKWANVATFIAGLSILYTVFFVGSKYWWPKLKSNSDLVAKDLRSLKKIILWFFVLTFLLVVIFSLNLDYIFTRSENFDISISLILKALLVLQVARFLDWVLVNIYIKKYYVKRDRTIEAHDDPKESISSAAQIVKYILYTTALIIIVRSFHLDVALYSVTLNNGDILKFTLTSVISAFLILLFARLIIWLLTQLILYGVYSRNKIDIGAQYAINQLLKYVIYVVAVIFALDKLGLNMTLVFGGAAALLVGIGLGLQQTFNDFFSGVVLLFERSVAVGDILEVDGQVGIVKKIGLRSSIVETRENTSTIVPNSFLVNRNVINWTHFNDKVRFDIFVGVAYGSDTALVKKILLEVANSDPAVLNYPAPFVRFINFDDSSLSFSLHFYSKNYFMIEDTKSDLRFAIDLKFRENNIAIPFPQRDVWIRKTDQ